MINQCHQQLSVHSCTCSKHDSQRFRYIKIGFHWWKVDQNIHVNVPELKTGMLARIKISCKGKTYKLVRLVFDNETPISYVKNKAGIKKK